MSEADPDMQQAMHDTAAAEADQFPVGGEIDGPGKQYFEDVVIDNLMDAFLELSAAVWTIRDRNIVLEQVLSTVLAEQGKTVDLGAMIEAYQPTPEVKAARAAERAEMVKNVFASFSKRTVNKTN
ncbi:MAG: hypothetical protein AAF607_12830 [Pseudomonadota bacterium]